MAATRRWTVDIVIDEREDERTTQVEARLSAGDEQVSGREPATGTPMTSGTPRIGDELAAARALSELARRLVLAAAEDIEQVTDKPAHLRG
jgi:hypothetical protein